MAHADIRTNIKQNAETLASLQETVDNLNVPTKTSELENDSGFITAETMPEVDVSGAIAEHDTSNAAHEDIRQEITFARLANISALREHDTSNAAHEDIRQAIAANTGALQEHMSMDNPHKITVDKLGLKPETWTFTLEDGSTVTKAVYVG